MVEQTEKSFDHRKTKYCSEFAVSHLSSFRPHFQYGQTLGKSPEVWRNVSEHCLVAGIFADILAEDLELSSEDRKNVVKAALLHDWFKKHEAMAQREAAERGGLTLEDMDELSEVDSEYLRKMNVSEEIIKIKAANVPDSIEGLRDDTEKILWYVDAMLTNTSPSVISNRFDDLKRGWTGEKEDRARAVRNNSFSNAYKAKYEGKSLYEVQLLLGDKIGREFSERIGFEGDPDQLPLYLKEKFVERVNSR